MVSKFFTYSILKNKVSFKGSFTFNNKLYNLNIKKQKGITLLTSKPKNKVCS